MRRNFLMVALTTATALFCSPALSQKTPLTWWEHSNPPHNEYSKQLVEEWNKAHSNTPIRYEFFAMTPYFKKLTAALSTRSAADMFTVIDTLLPSFTTKNILGPIRPEWLGYKDLEDMKKAYLPGALDGYIDNGKLYAVPPIASVFSLYINKKHFQEAGSRSRQGLSAHMGGHRHHRQEAGEGGRQQDGARGLRLRDALLHVDDVVLQHAHPPVRWRGSRRFRAGNCTVQ